MQKLDYQTRVLEFIESKPRGTLFINSDFFDIAVPTTIRQILKRLTDEGKIARILDGMYSYLEYSSILKKDIYPSPVDVAYAIARRFKWSIYPSGHTALNIVGISTQVSNGYEFLSDGPYKKYEYLNYQVKFKKTASRKININSHDLTILVIALDLYGKDRIKGKEIAIINKYIINKKISEKQLKQATTIPEWIYLLIKNQINT